MWTPESLWKRLKWVQSFTFSSFKPFDILLGPWGVLGPRVKNLCYRWLIDCMNGRIGYFFECKIFIIKKIYWLILLRKSPHHWIKVLFICVPFHWPFFHHSYARLFFWLKICLKKIFVTYIFILFSIIERTRIGCRNWSWHGFDTISI